MSREMVNKKEKTMEEVSKGFEKFIKNHKKKVSSKSDFNKALKKVVKQSSAK
jgi:hypothetical protein